MTLALLRAQAAMVFATIVLFLAALAANLLLFPRAEYSPGIAWVYLPAGVRLLCTLLFAEAGAVGLLLVSWGVAALMFPQDAARAFMGGVLAALAPYLVYRFAQRAWNFQSSLAALTPGRLLLLAVLYSLASPLLHHLWFAVSGADELWRGFLVMFVGDLTGTLLVLYVLKLTLWLVPQPQGGR